MKRSLEETWIIWQRNDDDEEPVCFASSHEDANARITALESEHDALAESGLTQERVKYFYTGIDGSLWKYNKFEKRATPILYVDEPKYAEYYTEEAEKVGTHVYVHIGEQRFLGSAGNASCAFKAEGSTYGEDDRRFRKFWKQIRAMNPTEVQLLRAIYTTGDYAEIPEFEEKPDDYDSSSDEL